MSAAPSGHGKHEAPPVHDPVDDAVDGPVDDPVEDPAERPDDQVPTEPALRARGLSLGGGRGPVFRDVELTVDAGEVVVLVGDAGTGRSCLLLALTGRMAGATGDLTVGGHSLGTEPRVVRARTSVARIGETVVAEPNLTIAESIADRALIDGVKGDSVRQRFDAAADILGLDADRATLVDELSAIEQTALHLALAFIAPADVIVLDDIDHGLNIQGLQQLCARMVELAADGTAIVATTVQPPEPLDGLRIVPLQPHHPGDS